MVKRDFSWKPRDTKNLPPEKLLEILCGIYPENVALEAFHNLMGKSDEQEERREGNEV